MKHTPTLVIIVAMSIGIVVFHALRQRCRRRPAPGRDRAAEFEAYCETVAMIRRRQAIIRQAMEPVGEGPGNFVQGGHE